LENFKWRIQGINYVFIFKKSIMFNNTNNFFLWSFKTREIDDRIWLIFSSIGIIITFIEYFLKYIDFSYLVPFISILITIIVSIIIYYSKFVGGADLKALISISFLDSINFNKNTIHPFTPLIVLTNSCIISLIIPLIYIEF